MMLEAALSVPPATPWARRFVAESFYDRHMCGRFVAAATASEIADYFDAVVDTDELPSRYNVAPTQDVYVVVSTAAGVRSIDAFHWGLVPSWAKSESGSARRINARVETAADRPMFAGLFAHRRCIVPANGFYEWQRRSSGTRQPYFIADDSVPFLALGAIWTAWHTRIDGVGQVLRSVAILTTAADESLLAVHTRMPVTIDRSDWDRWLNPHEGDTIELSALLSAPAGANWSIRPVSDEVNSSRHEGPQLIAAIQPPVVPEAGQLF